MREIQRLFNSHKMKYVEMDNYFRFDTTNEKVLYVFLDFDLIFMKYLYTIGYTKSSTKDIDNEMTKVFIAEFLNLIAHYKQFFYTKLDAMSFFYIGIPATKYTSDKVISKLIKQITKLITVIPRLHIYYYENDTYNFFLKYNLTRTIIINKQNSPITPIFIDMSKPNKCELMYTLTKNYSIFKFDDFRLYLYGFNDFRADYLHDIDDIHINSVISLLPIYIILNDININKKVRIDDIIMKFINTHPDDNFTSLETQLLVLKLFTKMKKLEFKLRKLHNNMHSPIYATTMKIITENWKRVIKDSSIYNINEMLDIPKTMRIKIETLMKY